MADGEDIRDTSARLLATAALATGAGVALYKGFKESPGELQRIAEAVRGGTSMASPRMITHTPAQEFSQLLSEGFSAMEDTMSPGGMAEMLRRSYERALYSSGVIADEDRGRIVAELVEQSKSWEMAQSAIRKYEHQLGGMEGVHQAMREISGGTIRGARGKGISQLIRELPNIGPDEFGRRGGYLRSSFEPGGQFWKDRFNLNVKDAVEEIPLANVSAEARAHAGRIGGSIGRFDVEAGVRQANRPRDFMLNQAGDFKFRIPGVEEEVSIPYSELRIGRSGAIKEKRWFLQTPNAVQHRGIQFVAADHRGMGYAAVPHIAVPKAGGGYEIMEWNKALNVALYGDGDRPITGLATRLHDLHGDEKAMRDLTWEWNTRIRGLYHRVTGSQRNLSQALMHSESVVPLDRLMAEIYGEEVDTSMDALIKSYDEIGKAVEDFARKNPGKGYEIGALAGADPMAKHHRFAMKDWAKRWELFGEGYAMERKFAGRIKPFEMTEEAVEAMAKAPLGGTLERGWGITATAAMKAETGPMPQAAAYLSLGDARHFGKEEAVISSNLSGMMKMRQTQKFEVLAGSTMAATGELLQDGVPIGVDYRTGETIYARGAKGLVEQKIIDARTVGNITKIEVETILPLQDQMKIFGFKAQVHMARGSIEREIIHEWGAGKAGIRFAKDIEFIGHADLMKKIPQEINKQMAEAQFLIMQKRMSEAGVLRSGGKSKVMRQRLRKIAGQKTYTYKGGLPKDYVNMNMVKFVRDEQYRTKVLQNRKKAAARLSRRMGLKKEEEALGVGLELLRYAKKQGFDAEEMSLVGGAFYKVLVDQVGESQAEKMLKAVGVHGEDIRKMDFLAELKGAKGVLAMPTMHVGGYATFDHRWRGATMDYRALMEIKAQQWGEAGDLLVGEIARRVMPAQNLVELEKAALSVAGRANELPEGIERITSIREAQESIGSKSFIFDYGGKEVYVPKGDVRGLSGAMGMGQFATEAGDVRSQELRSAYEKYFAAHKAYRDRPDERTQLRLDEAAGNLERKIHKGWAGATSTKGRVVGTAGPVARRRVPRTPEETMARVFGGAGSTYEEALEQFAKAGDQVFTVGVTRETGHKMFRELISRTSGEERAFLEAQQEAFLAGGKVTGFVWRHPTHRPQSLMPAWFELVEGRGESAQFHRLELKHGERVLDVSLAAGMKLDYDFDHVQLGLIADEKVKVAQDTLMNSRRYREQFVQGVAIQYDIMKKVKDAAAAGIATKNVEGYVAGLQRLVGVKLETGTISNLVGEMRAAAAFQASGDEFRLASYLLAELEEGPISSKHGLHVGEVSTKLKEFVRGEGVGVRDAMREAWDVLLKEGTFEAGQIKYSREEFVDKMSTWIARSEESGDLAAFRDIARRGAQAQKGAEHQRLTMQMLSDAIDAHRGGRGDLNAALVRTMRMGPGSGITPSRQVASSLRRLASTAVNAFKKHWKYPAMGIAAAVGISALGGDSITMRDHDASVNALGGGPAVPHVAPPMMNPNRIVSGGGGSMPVGYGMHGSQDFSAQGIRQVATLANETGASVRIRDDRGSITPEYIAKVERERYY